jgi:hypothetical protein
LQSSITRKDYAEPLLERALAIRENALDQSRKLLKVLRKLNSVLDNGLG